MLDEIKGPEFATIYGLAISTQTMVPTSNNGNSTAGNSIINKIKKLLKSFSQ